MEFIDDPKEYLNYHIRRYDIVILKYKPYLFYGQLHTENEVFLKYERIFSMVSTVEITYTDKGFVIKYGKNHEHKKCYKNEELKDLFESMGFVEIPVNLITDDEGFFHDLYNSRVFVRISAIVGVESFKATVHEGSERVGISVWFAKDPLCRKIAIRMLPEDFETFKKYLEESGRYDLLLSAFTPIE